MNRRILALLSLALVVGTGLVGVTGSSSATWVSATTSRSTVTAAADWTPPTVQVVQPGSPTRGTVTVTATANDAESGIASVTLQVRAASGSQWRTLCTTATSPYACSWNTTAETDGSHELRARATDRAGHATTSAVVRTTVANSVGVLLAHPGSVVSGSVPLQATITGVELPWTVRIERATAGSTNWQPLCGPLAAPYSCTWDTTGTSPGHHDLRAVASAGTTTIVSPVVSGVLVDNVAPTVALTVPGGPLRGEVVLTTTATDAHSGIATVVVQAATSASGPWTDLCSTTAAASACRYDTTKLPYGQHLFRAVATDKAGNRTTTSSIGPRLIDNTTRSITLADPGSWLEGTVALNATAMSTAPIASVKFQRAPKGGSSWTDVCSDAAAPWTCDFDTRKVADGSYDLRAVLTDTNGNQAISNLVTSRTVDNVTTAFRGVDVQTTNGGIAGRVDDGDTLVFTFSRRVDLTSVTPGWNGSPLPVHLEVRDAPGLAGITSDDFVVTRSGSTVNLGSVRSNANYIGLLDSHATLDATLVASNETVNGVPRTVVTVRINRLISGGVRTINLGSLLTWTPSAQVVALSGQTSATTSVTESTGNGKDF